MADKIEASVIIATRNRAGALQKTLHSLASQDLRDVEWELFVVDNGSADDTQDVIAAARETLPIVPLIQPVPGKNRALNTALPRVHGHLVIFTDDDVRVSEGWLKEHLAAARRWPSDVVFGGPVKPRFPPGTPAWMSDPGFPFSVMAFARYEPEQPEGPISAPPFGPNLSLRRSVFENHRFNEGVGPDGTQNYKMGSESELLLRLASDGHRFIYVPNASVDHVITQNQTDVAWLVRRASRAGRQAAVIAAEFDGVKIKGVPRYLWRMLATDMLRVAMSVFATAETRCVRRMELSKTWAMVKEIMRRRASTS